MICVDIVLWWPMVVLYIMYSIFLFFNKKNKKIKSVQFPNWNPMLNICVQTKINDCDKRISRNPLLLEPSCCSAMFVSPHMWWVRVLIPCFPLPQYLPHVSTVPDSYLLTRKGFRWGKGDPTHSWRSRLEFTMGLFNKWVGEWRVTFNRTMVCEES